MRTGDGRHAVIVARGRRRRPGKAPGASRRVGWPTVALATLLPLALAFAASAWLGMVYSPLGMAVDVALLAVLLSVLRLSARGPLALWGVGLVYAAVFVLSHAVKLAQLRLPVMAADATALVALLQVLSGWRLWCAGGILAVLVLLSAWALWPRRRGWPGLVLAAAWLGALVMGGGLLSRGLQQLSPLATPDDLVAKLARYGGAMFLLDDYATFRAEQVSVPGEQDVARAVAGVAAPRLSAGPGFRPRNVHLVLLEATWEPLALGHYTFSRDPFDPRFRHALDQGRGSAALVPGFGGATANAEFEVLCGLPATRDQVAFEHTIRNAMPCLPRVLREAGYLAQVSHPYDAAFWNRDEAYPRLGFERYYPINAFELDNMDGMFLFDASTYRQVLARLKTRDDPRPVFNYVVGLSSHFPFDRDRTRRPDLVEVTPASGLLQDYANAIAYSTRAFMDYVDAVHRDDPDAIIVAFGDHAPALGYHPDPYAASGIDMSGRLGLRTAGGLPDASALSRVPLLVFDGRRGVVPVGKVPLYMLPDVILSLLGPGAPGSVMSAFREAGMDPARQRMFLGFMMVDRDGRWQLCSAPSRDCDEARAVRDRLVVLRQDLALGDRHGLRWMQAEALAPATGMAVEKPRADCGIDVTDWGPKQRARGEAFNRQGDGSSTLWFKIRNGRGNPVLRLGEALEVPLTLAGATASAGLTPAQLDALPDTVSLRWACPDGSGAAIGEFHTGDVAVDVAPADAGAGPGAATACAGAILAHGPEAVRIGEPFNAQPDGRSAFWLLLEPGSQGFELWLGGHSVAFARQADTLSFEVSGELAALLSKPGELALQLRCGDAVVSERTVQVTGEPRPVDPAAAVPSPATSSGQSLPAREPRRHRDRAERFIAHAGGLAWGWDYTNSREALDQNHARGFRWFEVDLSWTADDALVLIHDWGQTWRRYFGGQPGAVPTLAGFREAPMRHGLTAQALADVIDWLRAHPEAVLVTDVKERNLEALAVLAREAPDLRTRIVPQAYEPGELAPLKALGFPRVILTVYRSPLPPSELAAAATTQGAWALTVPEERVRAGDYDQVLDAGALPVYVHTVNKPAAWASLAAAGVEGLYTDDLFPGTP